MSRTADDFARAREGMVKDQLEARDVSDPAVLAALRKVPRHLFVPAELAGSAYGDYPVPVGAGQTISQPYIVAKMTELARLKPGDRVLEIGTGSGYQAAVLAELGCQVYSIEIIASLSETARRTLDQLGYRSVQLRIGDGYLGWPEQAPFQAILVTAAPPRVPEPLLGQLAMGGRMVIPVGELSQQLKVITRNQAGFDARDIFDVRFVPMTGQAQDPRAR